MANELAIEFEVSLHCPGMSDDEIRVRHEAAIEVGKAELSEAFNNFPIPATWRWIAHLEDVDATATDGAISYWRLTVYNY